MIEVLNNHRFSTDGLRSKDWNEFAQPGVPQMDFVFTVCGNAAAEKCPVWPRQPMTAHWMVTNPAAVAWDDATRKQAFRNAFIELEAQIKIFVSFPLGKLETMKLQKTLDDIGTRKAEEYIDNA